MIKKLLVANRGEIAVRILRTAKEMGIDTVAVYSEADDKALHVLTADEAVPIGEAEPTRSYLDMNRIVDAARRTGADAVHPGYGFLAENPAFVGRLTQEGLTFVGPGESAMKRLGNKTTARTLAESVGVPIIPGMTAPSSDSNELLATADRIGYPVLVKAAGGGGGKGMRLVREKKDLAASCEQAASEAKSAFGDPTIYLEKAIDRPRHVEVQILADAAGSTVHLFERECSVQRRHQKIIEESPSPVVDTPLRERMGKAAVTVAMAAGYTNAGTVEFLVDRHGQFYFLEVNTRLQVEHPVTEMVTGLDMVRRQIEIAGGEPLPFSQSDLTLRGHSIECRIYAEDPELDFIPSPGTILLEQPPLGPGVRYDSGIYTGFEVPVYYDPILSKLIVWAEDRRAAIARMTRALKNCVILGVKTPIELLLDILASSAFRAGELHTGFLDEHFPGWKPDTSDDFMDIAQAAYDIVTPRAASTTEGPSEMDSPWQRLGRWDLV